MKKLSFLFSVLVLTMMAQNLPSIGEPPPPPSGCTNVTVKYTGGTVYSERHVDAYNYIPCTSDVQQDHYTFKAPIDTLTIKQNTNLQIASYHRFAGNDIHESTGTRSQINIECPCSDHGDCEGCHIVSSSQKSKSL